MQLIGQLLLTFGDGETITSTAAQAEDLHATADSVHTWQTRCAAAVIAVERHDAEAACHELIEHIEAVVDVR